MRLVDVDAVIDEVERVRATGAHECTILEETWRMFD